MSVASAVVSGLLEIAAAVALIAGIWFQPIGVAGAIGSTLYFTGAIVAHIRAIGTEHFLPPFWMGAAKWQELQGFSMPEEGLEPPTRGL
jgi:DoxX-like family